MKTLSGSSRIVRPKWYCAGAEPRPRGREVVALRRRPPRAASRRRRRRRRTTTEVDAVAIQPAVAAGDAHAGERDHERRRRAARAGRSRRRRSRSASQRLQPVDVEWRGAAATSRRSARGRRRPRTRRPPSRRSRTPGPSPRRCCRENAIRARLPPLSMISSESRTISGERRSSTPSAPIEKRIALTARYQVTSGPSIDAPADGLRRACASGGRGRRRRPRRRAGRST